ncbi:MAG: HDIG domain-containing protein [Peptococcaceae bacterium]|nr:HDIG domain-containing protein [Peptococcaceae bacterium]
MERSAALDLVKRHVKNKNLQKHMLAVEMVMGGLAARFGEDVALWRLTGLLHDIDYDLTADKPAVHSLMGAEMLADYGLPSSVVNAVRAHNEWHGLPRDSMLERALYCSDPVTGLIVAGALIHPTKKLAAIDTEFVLNRYHEKSFARGANRETIAACREIGLSLAEFISLALTAMQPRAEELGL